MADISTYIEKIRTAVYGEEVRGSIIGALQAVNTVTETSDKTAQGAVTTAQSAVTSAANANNTSNKALRTVQNVTVKAHTLETGEEATVSKSLDGENLSLDFGLPKGPQGETIVENIPGNSGQVLGYGEDNVVSAVDVVNSFDGVKGGVVRSSVEEFYENYHELPDFANTWASLIYWNTVESLGITPGKDSIMVDIDVKLFEYQYNDDPIGAGVHCTFAKSDGSTISDRFKAVYASNQNKGIWTHVNVQAMVPVETKYIWILIFQENRPFVYFGVKNFNIKKLDDKKTQILPFYHPPLGVSHRSIYRGKYLGTSVNNSQYMAINTGSFFDIFIGDYWIINGTKYIVADLDYWYNTGDTNFTKHHAVIVPESNIGVNKRMNSSDTTDNAYYGSEMYSTNLNDAKTKITTDFGDAHILSHRIVLENATKDGYPSGFLWVDSKIDLMTETMVYGTRHNTPMGTGLVTPAHHTVDKTQLALFKLYPQAISTRQDYWLRDVAAATAFAFVDHEGYANYYGASRTDFGVRPAFAIGLSQ